jgi:arylsulfatase A-like enzyme
MKRLIATALACACLALVVGGCGAGPEDPDPEAPNVVLITLDGLRRDHVSWFGYPRATTPNIDWLASRGLALSNMVPTSCSTKISLTSLFTSRDYPNHSVADWRQVLDDENVTLAEIFRDGGYATAGFVGSSWIVRKFNYGQGFDVYEDFRDSEVKKVEAHLVVGGAMEYLRALPRERERPFFLYLHLKEPHPPWRQGSPWLTQDEASDRFFDKGCLYIPSEAELAALPDATRRSLIAKYDGAIKYADDWIGVLLATLRSIGEIDRSIIAVSTDHGIELADRYSGTHGLTPFDEVVGSFLMLFDGRRSLSGRIATDVQGRIFDIGPTLLALAEVPAPEGLDGIDLIGSPGSLPEYAFTTCYMGQVVRSPSHKLIHVDSSAFDRPSRRRPAELDSEWKLFDLRADSGETQDVREGEPEVFARMQQALRSYGVTTESDRLTAEAIEMLGENSLERLRALGYVE